MTSTSFHLVLIQIIRSFEENAKRRGVAEGDGWQRSWLTKRIGKSVQIQLFRSRSILSPTDFLDNYINTGRTV